MEFRRLLASARRGGEVLRPRSCAGVLLLGGGALALLLGGCAARAAQPGVAAGLRPTNVELYIASQSCFQGEVVPCG